MTSQGETMSPFARALEILLSADKRNLVRSDIQVEGSPSLPCASSPAAHSDGAFHALPRPELDVICLLDVCQPKPVRPISHHLLRLEKTVEITSTTERSVFRNDDDPVVLGWRSGDQYVVGKRPLPPPGAPFLGTIPLPDVFDNASSEDEELCELESVPSPTGSYASNVTFLDYPEDNSQEEDSCLLEEIALFKN
ncbi:hypothetical protein BC835DRAFT_1418304 [Cytidiella melzeri]|nr:hypothetical protein BC835DRAFT_1418304 [Cytidiella melzeri]